MVSHLRKNLPFGLQTALLFPTNQVPQVPVGRAGPPPAPASGPAFEIMKVIIMSLSLLPPGRREVKLPMESSHLTHSTSSSRIHHLTGCILHTSVYSSSQSNFGLIVVLVIISRSRKTAVGHHYDSLSRPHFLEVKHLIQAVNFHCIGTMSAKVQE